MPDFEKLDDVMNFIEAHPEMHAQEIWGATSSCGTTACFAGWTALLNGYHLDARDNFRRDTDGQVVSPADVAQRILGLSYEQAGYMFWGTRSRSQLRRFIESLRPPPEPEPVDKPEVVDLDTMLADEEEEIVYENAQL
jgi:hypothetical protein